MGGRVARRDERGGKGGVEQRMEEPGAKIDRNCRKIKQNERCKCVPSDLSVSRFLTETCPHLTTVPSISFNRSSFFLSPSLYPLLSLTFYFLIPIVRFIDHR